MCAYPAGLISALLIEVFSSDLAAKRLAHQMKEENAELCVIVSSALRSGDLPANFSYDAVLQKPVNAKDVLAVVEKLLLRGSIAKEMSANVERRADPAR